MKKLSLLLTSCPIALHGIVADPDPVADPNDCPKSGLGSINKTVNPNPG